MTNKEILRASYLDIIFENRNKDYGAYTLRRDYNHRLLIALGAAMSAILLFILINAFYKNDEPLIPGVSEKTGIVIHTVEIPPLPDPPKEIIKPHPAVKVATIKYINRIEIKPDDEVKSTVPDQADFDGKVISTQTSDGAVKSDIPKSVEIAGANSTNGSSPTATEFIPNERDPEFPGGQEALRRFLGNNLNTPGDLEAGEKKMVQVRFKVEKDGLVSTLEIVSSGGAEFDKEVIRVCKKMPRWKPAIQNGINVPVSYMLPVTFIGVEQ